MAVLLRAKQIACAADFQITHCNFEAGAKLGEITDGGQSLARVVGQHFVWSISEISESLAGGAAHAAAQLVKLGKAKVLRILHNQGVDVGDVQPGLGDGGAKQNIALAS